MLKPNLQNIPVRTQLGHELREMARDKGPLLNADYSTIEESVVMATVPKCPKCHKVVFKCAFPDDCGMENL